MSREAGTDAASRTKTNVFWPLMLLALVALPLPYLLRFDPNHLATALIVGLVLWALTLQSPRAGIVATIAFLIPLGDYRRYASFFGAYPPNDPLLLVAPAAALLIVCTAVAGNRIRGSSALSAWILFFMVLMFAQIFNPLQGGIAVGFGGALFYLVPMLWFWIGRAYGTPEFVVALLRRVVLPLALLAALLGVYQSFFGLLRFEAAWVDAIGYTALYVAKDVVRAFGFSTSAAEFTRLLLLGEVIVVAAWLSERSRLILWLPLLLVAQFLASSRSPVVMFLGAAALLWSIQTRRQLTWAPRFVVAGAVGVAVATAALLLIQQSVSFGRIDPLVTHQVEGLLSPTDPTKSTAMGHMGLAWQAVVEGVASVVGHGLGSTTLAGAKFGSTFFGAEVDLSNMFYSLGLVGGLTYLAIMFLVLKGSITVWRRRRGAAELSLVAVIASTVLVWLLGSEYAIAAIVWFAIGAIDRAGLEVAAERKEKVGHARSVGDAQSSVGRRTRARESQRGEGGTTSGLARDPARF